jgi:hypothetical protein
MSTDYLTGLYPPHPIRNAIFHAISQDRPKFRLGHAVFSTETISLEIAYI